MKNANKIDKLVHDFKLQEGFSAETSGGLLICISKENSEGYIKEMTENGQICTLVGDVVQGNNKAVIKSDINIVEIWFDLIRIK